MKGVTIYTFAIGAAAAEAVGRQIGHADRTRSLTPAAWERQSDQLTAYLDRCLETSPRDLDLSMPLPGAADIRLVWQGFGGSAGLLYLVEGGVLRTVNILIARHDSSARRAAQCLAQALGGATAYLPCLQTIPAGRPPFIATFCSTVGGVDEPGDACLLAFAAAFFARADVRKDALKT